MIFFYVSLICLYDRDCENELFNFKRKRSEDLPYTHTIVCSLDDMHITHGERLRVNRSRVSVTQNRPKRMSTRLGYISLFYFSLFSRTSEPRVSEKPTLKGRYHIK